MRVLVTGAYGLIGSAILARLHRDGHQLIAAGRALDEARPRFPYPTWIHADFARLTTADAWRPLLTNIDAVVNCVGVLQDGGRDNMQAVQVEGTCALFDACVQAGVRRVVHISAVGASPRRQKATVSAMSSLLTACTLLATTGVTQGSPASPRSIALPP